MLIIATVSVPSVTVYATGLKPNVASTEKRIVKQISNIVLQYRLLPSLFSIVTVMVGMLMTTALLAAAMEMVSSSSTSTMFSLLMISVMHRAAPPCVDPPGNVTCELFGRE